MSGKCPTSAPKGVCTPAANPPAWLHDTSTVAVTSVQSDRRSRGRLQHGTPAGMDPEKSYEAHPETGKAELAKGTGGTYTGGLRPGG